MLNLIFVGAGGFGREVYSWAKPLFDNNKYRFKGFIDDHIGTEQSIRGHLPILGSIHPGKNVYKIEESDRFIFAIGDIDKKRSIIQELKSRDAKFITLIHQSAIVCDSAEIGEGVVICPFALISERAVISDFATINCYASCAHDSRVGKYAILSPYSTLNGGVELENEVFLGTHATVTAGLKIGKKAKISANSVAVVNIPPFSIVIGVPGKHKQIYFND